MSWLLSLKNEFQLQPVRLMHAHTLHTLLYSSAKGPGARRLWHSIWMGLLDYCCHLVKTFK